MYQYNRQRGFTLIEVMVVVVILALLAAIIVPKIMSRPEQARLVKAKQDILAVENAMDLYKLDNGSYPTLEQGISALVTKPTQPPVPNDWNGYLKQIPSDPWGHAYQYTNPGKHGEIDIYSFGPNNANSDPESKNVIGNWTIK